MTVTDLCGLVRSLNTLGPGLAILLPLVLCWGWGATAEACGYQGILWQARPLLALLPPHAVALFWEGICSLLAWSVTQ